MSRWHPETLEERFWRRVDKNGPVHPVLGTRCHLWLGPPGGTGYGEMRIAGVTVGVHVVAWTLIGELALPVGHGVLHHCDVRLCVNYAEHLFTGTPGDNARDMAAKGRSTHGDRSSSAKLSNDLVRRIRSEVVPGELQRVTAERFGVSQSTVSLIRSGLIWRRA